MGPDAAAFHFEGEDVGASHQRGGIEEVLAEGMTVEQHGDFTPGGIAQGDAALGCAAKLHRHAGDGAEAGSRRRIAVTLITLTRNCQ